MRQPRKLWVEKVWAQSTNPVTNPLAKLDFHVDVNFCVDVGHHVGHLVGHLRMEIRKYHRPTDDGLGGVGARDDWVSKNYSTWKNVCQYIFFFDKYKPRLEICSKIYSKENTYTNNQTVSLKLKNGNEDCLSMSVFCLESFEWEKDFMKI